MSSSGCRHGRRRKTAAAVRAARRARPARRGAGERRSTAPRWCPDVRGNILGRARRGLREYHDPHPRSTTPPTSCGRALVEPAASLERLRAGAVASGGAIDEDGVVRRLVFTEHWEGVDLPAELGRRHPHPLVRGQRRQPRRPGRALAGRGGRPRRRRLGAAGQPRGSGHPHPRHGPSRFPGRGRARSSRRDLDAGRVDRRPPHRVAHLAGPRAAQASRRRSTGGRRPGRGS